VNATVSIFTIGVALMAPILWAALGELVVEQSGVLNVGIEGVMLIGAFGAAIGYRFGGSLYYGLLVAIGSGVACGIGLALSYVRLGADQIVTGIVFNVFALGLTTTLYEKYLGGGVANTLPDVKIPWLGDIPKLGKIFFDQNVLVYAAFLSAPAVFYVIRHTWFGLYARFAGEHPRAVESAGLDVWRLRYPAVVLGCTLTAVGGATLVLSTSGSYVPRMTEGRGFIALAVVVLARWNPFGVILGCLVFGVARAIQFEVQDLGPLADVPNDIVLSFPYLLTIAAVVFARGSRYPAACGVPYRPSGSKAP
jgi:general nucleoside transport system permease protein